MAKLRIESPPEYAAGPKAIKVAVKLANDQMGAGKALKLLNLLNKREGIDCPGCAWPDPEKRSKLGEYCENGVKAIVEEAMNKKLETPFFEKYSIDQMLSKSDYWLGQQGRLTHPMIIREGEQHYQPISWEEAFKLISDHLKNVDHPDRAIFYTSGRTSNEAAFLYQLFVRMYGTNNLPDCSNMCHESSGVALGETTGIGKGSVTLDDLEDSELILIFGQNPATNHPRMLTSLEKAKKNGAKIITINPLKEIGLVNFKNPQTVSGLFGRGTKLTDLYLQVAINEDVALLKAVMKKLLGKAKDDLSILDHEFINNKTAGYVELIEDLEQYDLGELINRTGLKEADIDVMVDLIAKRKKIIACWAMGLTQHKNGVDNIREITNLLFLKGSIGKPGAGTCPVRGHSNVQGDRTMGIHEKPSRDLLDKIAENFGFVPPKEHGYSVIEAIKAMGENKADVFFALGGNFVPAAPDTYYTAKALQNCKLTVHVSTKLNRSHLIHGKIGMILPCKARSDKHVVKGREQVITVENSMGMVHTSKGVLDPPSKQLMAEPDIIANLAKATLENSKVDWDYLMEDYSRIRELIEQTIAGFENYNQKVKNGKVMELPNGARHGIFNTHNKKANFSLNKLPDHKREAGDYMMMTIRSHDQYNTTVYGLNDRYRGIFDGRMVVFMNREDVKREGLKQGDTVTLYNTFGHERAVEGFTVVPYDIPKGCVATYFPEANPLIPLDQFAHSSLTPASKSVLVKVRPL